MPDMLSSRYLNFRSESHVVNGNSGGWLRTDGWERDETMASAVTSGYPNGPYEGPVFRKTFSSAQPVHLSGSNNWEGTYLVFILLLPHGSTDGPNGTPGDVVQPSSTTTI
jgi:hypothetical protein